MKQVRFIPVLPKWNKHQMVSYKNRSGGVSRGKITSLETHYDNEGIGYQIYCIHTEGNKRSAWIGESKIIEGN